MLIIIEGVDGAGKTTLANRLERAIPGAKTIHRGPPTRHPLDEYVRPLERYRPGSGKTIICDRWHLGELVWPEIFGRVSAYTPAVHRYTEAFLHSRGAIVVQCMGSIRALQRRLVSRDGEAPLAGVLERAQRRYDYVCARSVLPDYVHSVERPCELEMVVNGARAAEHLAQTMLQHTYELVANSVRIKTLYVADRQGPSRLRLGTSLPLPPYPSTCGEWLARTLPDEAFAVTNATPRRAAPHHLPRLHELFDRPQVVALGNEAVAALSAYQIEHGATVHPQYAKRFWHRATSKYAQSINAARNGEDVRSWFRR